jgi:hypothetical protein
LNQTLRRELRGKDRIAQVSFKLAQRQAQSAAFKQRRAVLKADLWLDEALSFAGGEGV